MAGSANPPGPEPPPAAPSGGAVPAARPLPGAARSRAASPGRRPSPRVAQLKRTAYFFRQNTLAMAGLVVILFFLIIALVAPFYPGPNESLTIYCGSYYPGSTGNSSGICNTVCTYALGGTPPGPNCYAVPAEEPSLLAPTVSLRPLSIGSFPLGSLTEVPSGNLFYNTATGLIKGAPWSLSISIAIVGSGALIGLLLGALAGYLGGLTDEVIMRFTDIFLSIPALLLVLVVLSVAGQLGGFTSTLYGRLAILIGAFVVTWWPFYTRIVRGQVLVTREQKYIEAAKASGARPGRVLVRHIIPNSVYPVLVQFSLDVGTIPIYLGTIIYLGYPIWPTALFPEWGTITAKAVSQEFVSAQVLLCQISTSCTFPWWQILFPGLTVFLFAIAVNFLSDGLRDALDPRLRR